MTIEEIRATVRDHLGKRAYAKRTEDGWEIRRWDMSLHGRRAETVLGSGPTFPAALADALRGH